jgi:outer membrane protein insertion porin family
VTRSVHHTGFIASCFLLAVLFFCSCSTTKYVPEGDFLYKGSRIKVKGEKVPKSIIEEMEKTLRPAPNTKSPIGLNTKLMAYTPEKVPPEKKGFFGRMRKKYSEPPVLLSAMSMEDNTKRLTDVLFSRGYLKPEIKHVLNKKDKKANIDFNINTGTRYTIRDIIYPKDSTPLAMVIRSSGESTELKKGEYFDFDALKAERVRIDNYVKERGFYFYIPEYILFKADSLHLGTTDLYLTLIPEMPPEAAKQWQVKDVSIYGNYTLEKDSIVTKQNGKRNKEFTLVDRQERYKTDLYERTILIKEGQLYKKSVQTMTVERLMNLQNFRFVRTVYFPDTLGQTTYLNSRIYLTPAKKRTVRLELSGETKSNNYLGSSVAIRYRNLNLFRGAEILEAKVSAGYDFQVGGQQQSSRAYNLNGDVTLYVPKVLPYIQINTKKNSFMPRTFFTLGAEYVKRPEEYTLRSFKFSAGYTWKIGKSQEHNLRLINFNSVDPSDITPSFDSILNNDPALKASFEKQVIIGSKYNYTYNNTWRTKRKFNYIASLELGTSGNLFSLFANPPVDTPGAIKVFNVPVSQFVRVQADLRGYLKLHPRWLLASRIIAGSVFAYGNSSVAPYSEQFFIGGSSSVRAFRTRTLGPGSYHTQEAVYQANESGQLKLELNTELRYNFWKFLKLAAFVDGGNIWFDKDVPGKPGSGLDKGDLFGEMAVGAGLGFRFDFSVLVVRFDIAMPLRKPWYPEGSRWVFNEINFGSKAWRENNLILNIGIGYPF